MTARTLRPDALVFMAPVLRVLQKEGLVRAEVVIGADGRGVMRFEGGHDGSCHCPDCVPEEVDFGGCPAVGVGGYHSEEYGDEDGQCQWCGEIRKK